MRKILLSLFVVLMAVSIILPATAQAKKPLKVAFVYIGPPGDMGWTYEHERGRLALQKYFGDK